VRKTPFTSYYRPTLPMFSVRKASLPSYYCPTLSMFSVRTAPITPTTPMFSPYWSVSELDIPSDDVVSTRTEAALEKISSLGEPTLVQQYAKLSTKM
jgi:hypothetical protein